VILGNSYDVTLGELKLDANSLLSTPEVWLVTLMTISYLRLQLFGGHILMLYSILIPWFTLRKVPVEVEIVSSSQVLLWSKSS
jgi:hypothetical protein